MVNLDCSAWLKLVKWSLHYGEQEQPCPDQTVHFNCSFMLAANFACVFSVAQVAKTDFF